MMKFEYVGKQGVVFGKFAAKVNGGLIIGEFESNPNTVKYNGAICEGNTAADLTYRFTGNSPCYSRDNLALLIYVLAAAHGSIFQQETDGDQL